MSEDVPVSYEELICGHPIPAAEPARKATNPKDTLGIAKVPTHVIPPIVEAYLGLALMEGALKYGSYNYRDAGVRGSVYYDADGRHMKQWWEGEDLDRDSGLPHVKIGRAHV